MPDEKVLPHLLRLLDDESEVVREAVARELAAFGGALEEELRRLREPPNDEQRRAMRALLSDPRRWQRLRHAWLHEAWPTWREKETPLDRLEAALSILAEFQKSPEYPLSSQEECVPPPRKPLSVMLDDLAGAFRAEAPPHDARALARFLFETLGIRGSRSDYYNPLHSSLTHVIETRRGIPITLACIYILTGRRLGLDIRGCNWPGHFFARFEEDGAIVVVDCFNGGACIDEESFLKMQGPSRDAAKTVLEEDAGVEDIVARVLHNLVHAYQHSEQWEDSRIMIGLLKAMPRPQH